MFAGGLSKFLLCFVDVASCEQFCSVGYTSSTQLPASVFRTDAVAESVMSVLPGQLLFS